MGRGLSPLQHEILAVLKARRGGWARPKDVIDALGREPTSSNRTVVSKALDRLEVRGLVEVGHGAIRNVGNSYLYRLRKVKKAKR
jgi:predicted transcriptional regulator